MEIYNTKQLHLISVQVGFVAEGTSDLTYVFGFDLEGEVSLGTVRAAAVCTL